MARTRTLTNLILDVRQRANMENSQFVSDAEITEFLNQGLAKVWGRLALVEGQPHLRSNQVINVAAPTALYALADDFWRLQSVTATISGITGILCNFNEAERGNLSNQSAWGGRSPVQYRIQGPNIEFLPATQTFVATLYYTPCTTRLVNPSDTVDGYNGYEVAAIYDAVAICLSKEDSDTSFNTNQRDAILAEIDALAPSRDAFGPERVLDVTQLSPWWGRS